MNVIYKLNIVKMVQIFFNTVVCALLAAFVLLFIKKIGLLEFWQTRVKSDLLYKLLFLSFILDKRFFVGCFRAGSKRSRLCAYTVCGCSDNAETFVTFTENKKNVMLLYYRKLQ